MLRSDFDFKSPSCVILPSLLICSIASKINGTPRDAKFVRKTAALCKFDHSNKFDLFYYEQVNSLLLKSSLASKWASKQLWR